MMLIVLLALAAACAEEELAITPEYVEHLKEVASWEVTEYEDSIFKGWTLSEVEVLLGDKKPNQIFEATPITPKDNLPSSIDWADNECIHKILDQGNCGSCWAFAAAGVASDKCCLETKPVDFGWLSPQELVSCDHGGSERKNKGCNGGFAYNAFDYVRENGLVGLDCMPYVARNSPCKKQCKDNKDWGASHKCKCQEITDCSGFTKLKACLAEGPVAARMAVYRDFLSYRRGVYCRTVGAAKLSDHAIRCVGFEEKDGERNVRCANSWSTYWGERGYFRIRPNDDCGFYAGESNIYTVSKCKD